MGSPSPLDPYLALGVAKDATGVAIKAQYRKLVLKFHPDKVQDESQKQAASDEFHRIQTAYEIVGDEDKRQRYDAQCKLVELRRDVMERQTGGGRGPEVRTAAYKVPTEAPRATSFEARGPDRTFERVSPTYEERRPAFAQDYFDTQPRSTAHKSTEREREPKRKSSKDEREKARTYTKETERAGRKEKAKKADRELKRDRDREQAYVEPDSNSESDEYVRAATRMTEEGLQRARQQYYEQVQRQREDVAQGYYDNDERARKLFSQWDGAWEHMSRSQKQSEPERRPSPSRKASAKDARVENIRREDPRPTTVRRGSGRSKTTNRDTDSRRSAREAERRPSAEIVDPPRERRPPPLQQSKSSPADFKLPTDKPRAQSVQIEREVKEDFEPKIKRSETMPHTVSRDRSWKDAAPQKASGLRQTELAEGLATSAATPEWNEPAGQKYRYGHQYADDIEIPTPDGYRTQVVEPSDGPPRPTRYTRSPSPIPDSRAKTRSASARHPTISPQPVEPPPMPRTTSKSYVYTPGQGVEHYSRPAPGRENSGKFDRDGLLFGEVRTTGASRQQQDKYSPPPDSVRYQHEIRPEDVKMQSGYGHYSRRPGDAHSRPSYSRSGSGNPVYVR